MRTNVPVVLLLLLLPHGVHADRITTFGDLVYEACMNGQPL